MIDRTYLHPMIFAVDADDSPVVTDSQGLPRFRTGQGFGEVLWVPDLVTNHSVKLVKDLLLGFGECYARYVSARASRAS